MSAGAERASGTATAGESPTDRALRWITVASVVGLIVLCVLWEGWLAPLRPGGTLLTLKAVPLLVPLRGLLHGRRYTYQWATMFILAYFTEGCVRGWSDRGMSQALALTEVALSLVFFAAAAAYARRSAPSRRARAATGGPG